DRQVTDAPRAALFHAGTACPTVGTHDVAVSAFEMQLQLLGAEYLMDDTEFWKTEQHFETLEVHAHRFLLLAVWMSRILRGILCLSMNDSQALFIGLRHWPQSWRRANNGSSPRLRPSSKARHTRLKCAFAYCVHFVDHTPCAGSA